MNTALIYSGRCRNGCETRDPGADRGAGDRPDAVTAGWQDGEIRTRPFRVTYATARLQTLDRGAPVSPWTVEKELGHGSRDMLEEVYGRVGEVRHRSEVVEYRVEQHFDWKGGEWVPRGQAGVKGAPVIFPAVGVGRKDTVLNDGGRV